MNLLTLPLILQGLIMFVDEFYFHEKRGLPRWEKLGHPLDTLTVFACFSYLLISSFNLSVYVTLCLFSCVFITKDEFIHTEKCSSTEHWLHSLLFVIHPICFLSAYLLWREGEILFIQVQAGLILIFMLYQIIRWSIPWPSRVK